MDINKIIVTDLILAGGLFTEEGYDLEESADNLADLKGRIIMGYLEEHYPAIEVYADIAIEKKARGTRPLEVLAYNKGGEIIPAASEEIQRQLSRVIADGIADGAWAVKGR